MNQLKICLVGKMRSGKSEVINHLMDKMGEENVELVDFGDALKDIAKMLYPEEMNTKNRKLLTTIGQHMRDLDEDVWINVVKRKIENCNKQIIVCASCRQQNEYDFLNKIGFLFVKVCCKDSLRVLRAEQDGDNFKLEDFVHETESKIVDFVCKYNIVNNNDKQSLYNQMDGILNIILNERGE